MALLKVLKSRSLKVNIISNYIGNGGSAILGMVFLPFYLKYLGSEAYGIIGIFTSLQTILFLLDSGLSYTLNKEISFNSILPESQSKIKSILRTFEITYWLLGIVALLVALLFSPIIASHWVAGSRLNINYITQCFYLLSFTLFFQFPQSLYTGGLLGSQRHLYLNLIKLFFALLKGIGAVLILRYVGNNLHNFFMWNLFVTALSTLLLRIALGNYVTKFSGNARFDLILLRSKIRFAAGLSGIALSSVLLSQLDKIVLSKMLSLENFGYYTIATTLGTVLYQFGTPLTQSYFPRLSELFAKRDIGNLSDTYNQGSQILALLVFPASFVLIFFGKYLLLILLHDPQVVKSVLPICSIYSMGVALNVMVNMPFILSLSYNNSRIFFWGNIGMSVLFFGAVLFGVHFWNALGAAIAWAMVNLIYIIVMPAIVHSKFPEINNKSWYVRSALQPFLISGLTLFLFKYAIPISYFISVVQVLLILIFGLIAVFLSNPQIMRKSLFVFLKTSR